MRVLVTGSKGFVGKNLLAMLGQSKEIVLDGFDLGDDLASLEERVRAADFVFHLAGVNRPQDPEEFQTGNVELTKQVLSILETSGRATPIVLSSSTQARLDNSYGKSKKAAEEAVFAYGRSRGAEVCVYRLPNVFGKWGRPNYNSAVATFCHQLARDLPIQVNDPDVLLTLVYIDDLLEEFSRALTGKPSRNGEFCEVPVTHQITVGELAARIQSFRNSRNDLSVPEISDPLSRKLYSTYLSNLPVDSFSYPLAMHQDARGSFTEFLRTPERGQVSVNISKPGITKGNHWHHTKAEKFLVVSGNGVIRFRHVGEKGIISYEVSGEKLTVVDIPPGYTHNITNLGDSDMVTVMWASEPFDPARPDTIFEVVEK